MFRLNTQSAWRAFKLIEENHCWFTTVHVFQSIVEAYDVYVTCYAGWKRATFTVHLYFVGIVFDTQRTFDTFKEHSVGTYFGRLTYSPNIIPVY